MTKLKLFLALSAIVCSGLAFASCSKPEPREERSAAQIIVEVPRARNAELDPAIANEVNRTTSLSGSERYVGRNLVTDDYDFRDRIKELAAKDSQKPIYFQAWFGSDYRDVLTLFAAIRDAGMRSVALVVWPVGQQTYQRLTVRLSEEPDVTDDIPKPSPMALDIDVKGDGKILLNKKQAATVAEVEKLLTALADPLKTRTADADKTVTVKGTKSLRYDDIVKVVDTAKGAGASSIVLVLDDILEK